MESTLQNPALAAARTTPKVKTIVYWTVTALFCLEMGFTAYYMLTFPESIAFRWRPTRGLIPLRSWQIWRPVGSRTGAVFRRSGLACCSPFPLGVPQ